MVCERRGKRGYWRKGLVMKKILILGFILIPLTFLGAEDSKPDAAALRKPGIESMEITPNPVGRGDLFTITLIVSHNNSAEVDFPLDDLPEFLQLWRGPYIRSFIDTDKTGNSVRKVRITTTFKARSSGRKVIPSLRVVADSHEFLTEPRLLSVGLYKNRQLYMPIEAEWEAGFDKIYAGEAVPVSLMVRNQEVVVIFDRTRVAFPRDGFFEEAGGTAGITAFSEGDIVLYDIPAATYIYTSPVAGEVKIPSAGVDYNGITGWTDNLVLRINRAPSEIRATGAIGNFDFTASLDKTDVRAGENFSLTAVVSGEGNLNYLKIPEPEAEGCILVSSEESSDYRPGPSGYSGSKTVRWIYSAETPGLSVLRVPDFIYLEKESDQLITVRGNEYSLNISAAAADLHEPEAAETVFERIDLPETLPPVWRNLYRSWLNYLWFLPGAIFFVLVLLMKGRRLPLALILTVILSVSILSAGSFLAGGQDTVSKFPADSRQLYNNAITAYEDGKIADSLHNIRTAVYNDPTSSLYRDTLGRLETEYGQINAVKPSVGLHPDIFYFILMISLNLFFLAAVFRMVKPGGTASVLVILFGLIIILSSAMITYVHFSRESLTAVVRQGGSYLKKIPRPSANDWLPLDAGTALRVIESSEGYLLVETGLGVKGWISEELLITDRADGVPQ